MCMAELTTNVGKN